MLINIIDDLIESSSFEKMCEAGSQLLGLNLENASVEDEGVIDSVSNILLSRYKLLRKLHMLSGTDKQVIQKTVDSLEKTTSELRRRLPTDVYLAANELATEKFYATEKKKKKRKKKKKCKVKDIFGNCVKKSPLRGVYGFGFGRGYGHHHDSDSGSSDMGMGDMGDAGGGDGGGGGGESVVRAVVDTILLG